MADVDGRHRLATAGFDRVTRFHPSWDQVYEEDLVSVWHEAACTPRES
jgi:hypothetical protein